MPNILFKFLVVINELIQLYEIGDILIILDFLITIKVAILDL